MKHSPPPSSFSSKRGSILVVVIVMTLAAGIVAGSLLSYARTEARLNQSDLLYNEARLAAESTMQHGMAQLRDRFDRTRQISPAEMDPSRDSSLQLEPGFLKIAGTTRMQVPSTYTPPSSLKEFLAKPTILGALVVDGGNAKTLLIDPSTALPQEGFPGVPTSTSVREIQVIAKATVEDDSLGTRTAYVEQTFQVLDRSLFQNTVFFNGLLEIFPGGRMNLGLGGGPIYGSDVFTGLNVRYHTRVESSGGFYIGRYHNDYNRNNKVQLTDFRLFDGTVTDPDDADYLVSNLQDGVRIQTGLDNFRELALQNFAGGLLTAEHGISSQAAVGLEFLKDMALADAADKGIDFNDSDGEFDQGKFDREAGNFGHLLIEPSRGLTDLSSASNEAERKQLEALNTVEQNKWANRSALALRLDPATDSIRMFHQPTTHGEPEFDSSGQRVRSEIDVAATFPKEEDKFWTVERFSQPGGKDTDVESGIYDFRQARGSDNRDSGRINLVRVDMQKMREWVEETNKSLQFEDEWWNGGIYVELPEEPDPGRDDYVIPARSDWAVQLHNAKTIPNRAAVETDAAKGLTLATNGALYVQGSYNAPEGRQIDPDFALDQGAEVPAALVADAIMLLSDAWDNRNSGREDKDDHRKAVDSVYSTALVMGNVIPERGYSGGLENFPRFLESWGSGTDATYRGSLIRLFRSESFDEEWGHSNVYDRPERDWSFHTGFREHSPPLDTGPRAFRRVYFKELTEQQFAERAAEIFKQ
jgi:type II secretory pathway pseudopilin PulG